MAVGPTSPAIELAAALRRREVSSVELLSTYLDRVAALNPELTSVVTLDPAALEDARCADAELAAGHLRGPLHGLPITVKDALETRGLRSTGGSPSLLQHVPAADATAVARLRAAGAVVFGKTNVPEWSGDMQTYNDVFGTTTNPWRTTCTPGGSSGGAAAAVAAGLSAFEIGTDIGGSIRIPAHLCGIYGLRPSFGLVPGDGYLAGPRTSRLGLDLNVVGPLARSADDLDAVLAVLAGPRPEDAGAWSLTLPPPATEDARGLRVGLWLDDPFAPVERACAEVLAGLADALADAGSTIVEARPALSFEESFHTHWPLLMAAFGLNADPADPQTSHAEWLARDEERHRLRAVWRAYFAEVDVLLCPVLSTAAFPHDHEGTFLTRTLSIDGQPRTHVEVARWTGLVGCLGLPCAVAPVGRTADGLPVGVQIIADRWHDRTAVRAARIIGDLAGSGYVEPPLSRTAAGTPA